MAALSRGRASPAAGHPTPPPHAPVSPMAPEERRQSLRVPGCHASQACHHAIPEVLLPTRHQGTAWWHRWTHPADDKCAGALASLPVRGSLWALAGRMSQGKKQKSPTLGA